MSLPTAPTDERGIDASLAAALISVPPPRRQRSLRHVRPSTVIAILMLALVFFLAVIFPLLHGYDPYGQDLSHGLQSPFHGGHHLLGTDALGRDLASRASVAVRTSMLVVTGALSLNIVIGVAIGLTAGYFQGTFDTVSMGLVDVLLSFPTLILLVTVVAVVGPSATTIVLVLGLTWWVSYARMARAIALSFKHREFVMSSVTQGASVWWIVRKHLLPFISSQVVIMGSFDIGVLIVAESSLSYLGLGIQPPTPSLGGMIAEGQNYLQTDAWMCLLPGIILFLLVAGVQILSQRFTSEGAGQRASMLNRLRQV